MKRCGVSGVGCWGTRIVLVLVLVLDVVLGARGQDAAEILKVSGVKGGLIVHLGCGDGKLTATLRTSNSFIVHGLDADARNVEAARQHIQSIGLYGLVTVDRFDGKRLPYVDNLVNLVVAEALGGVAMAEVMRVLAPGGVAYIGGKKAVKPWPKEIDEWTHYLHGPDNNAVARDSVVGPPRGMQWLAEPRWLRNHHRLSSFSAAVTAQGRLFAILDEATSANVNVPGKWALVARDAFSGVRLWARPIASWAWHQIRFRSGPPQLPRLLVASGQRVYAPLGLNEPVSQLDAATGETLRTYQGTAGAEELILTGATLLVLKGEPVAEHAVGHERFKAAFAFPNRKTLVAIDAESGRTLWTWGKAGGAVRPETLASNGERVYVKVDEGVVCLGLDSGRELWRVAAAAEDAAPKGPKKKGGGPPVSFGRHVLVVAEGVVLANLAGQLTALNAADGKRLWACKAGGGFHAPPDVFVVGGIVWQGDHPSDSVAPPPVNDFSEGRDLRTGEVRHANQVMVDLQTAGHHHRCYRNKATERYILGGKRGIEMMDLAGDGHSRNNWVRGACQYGILPANGLLYAPPHACGCYMESLLKGFWALAPTAREPGEQGNRLEEGPAYPEIRNRKSEIANASEWPTYRRDPLRSGATAMELPETLAIAWRAQLGGHLTQPVIAAGKLLVASTDEHAVYALDAATGRLAWRYTCGGRVDSPPTLHGGLALFGSADGYVYCLRAADGALAWRFRAAPADTRAVACEQPESLWPVHGSVLVLDGVAYCSAGRSSWLDGGIWLYGLDPPTGRVVCQARLASPQPRHQEGKQAAKPEHNARITQNLTDYKTHLAADRSDSFSMAEGATADVLVSDGTSVFLRHVRFNPRLERQEAMARHLFSTSSLLDDAGNHRSHWVLGTGDFSRVPVAYPWIADNPGRWNPGLAVPAGVMLAFDASAVWGVERRGDATGRYTLYCRKNRPFAPGEAPLPDFRQVPKDAAQAEWLWRREFPARVRAMLVAGQRLYLATTPVDVPPDDPHAAYEGRRGGALCIVSARDGATLAEFPLDAPAVWDGLAAAAGRLYASTTDGNVICFARKESP